MLVDIIQIQKDLSLLRRSVDQERIYSRYRSELKRLWRSQEDFIKHRLFGFERRLVCVAGGNISENDTDVRAENKGQTTEFGENQRQVTNFNQPMDSLFALSTPSPPNGFVWEAIENSMMNVQCNKKAVKSKKRVQRVVALNDFPYYFEAEIEHWCLWKLQGSGSDGVDLEEEDGVTEKDIEWARHQLDLNKGLTFGAVENKGEIEDMLYWVNPPHLKSIPGIDHAHIICLRKTKRT